MDLLEPVIDIYLRIRVMVNEPTSLPRQTWSQGTNLETMRVFLRTLLGGLRDTCEELTTLRKRKRELEETITWLESENHSNCIKD